MPDKAAAIDALEQEYVTFRELIVDLPDAAYREVMLGVWDLEHVLAHMAGWYREMSGAFERVARGERPVPEGANRQRDQLFCQRRMHRIEHRLQHHRLQHLARGRHVMHFVEIEFFRRGDADQQDKMRGEKQDDGKYGASRSRNFGNRR